MEKEKKKTQVQGPRTKHWMSTIFDLEVDPKKWKGVEYCVWQKEKAPKTGKLHYQLYVKFTTTKRKTSLLKLYKGDWRRARSPNDANNYCQKADTRIEGPWFIGVWKEVIKQGDKFAQLHKDLKSKMDLTDIVDNHFGLYLRYGGNINKVRAIFTPKRSTYTQLVWIWGPSGAGKSTIAQKMAKMNDCSVYYKPPTTKWWPHYNQEDVVVIDDYKGSLYPALLFNLVGNSTPIVVEIKGADTQFNSTTVIITSVKHPRYIYGEDTHAWQTGLQRRCKGFTYWMDANHKVWQTDWMPCHCTDETEPPMKTRTEKELIPKKKKPVLKRTLADLTKSEIITLCKN